MKIAFVINYISKSGPSRVVLNIIRYLKNKSVDITVVTLFEGNDPDVLSELSEYGVDIIACSTLNRLGCLIGHDKELIIALKSRNFDIVHSHGFIPDILISRMKIKSRKITTLHSNIFKDYKESYGGLKGLMIARFHLKSLRRLDKCACCSCSVYETIKMHIKNACIIRNGITLNDKLPSKIERSDLNIPENALVYVFAGTLSSGKNIVWLIDQFVKYHNNNEFFLVIGNGKEAAKCRDLANDNVKLLGFKSNVIDYLKISDIYVSASKTEGFPISVLEAMSCGLGLLLSDIPSHNEIFEEVKDLYIGELFSLNANDPFSLIRYKNISKSKIKKCQNKYFSSEKMADDYFNTYQELL